MKVFAVILTLLAATSAFASADECTEKAQILGRLVSIQSTAGDLCVGQIQYEQFTPLSECPLLRSVVSHFGGQVYLECDHRVGSVVDGVLNRPAGSSQITLDN